MMAMTGVMMPVRPLMMQLTILLTPLRTPLPTSLMPLMKPVQTSVPPSRMPVPPLQKRSHSKPMPL